MSTEISIHRERGTLPGSFHAGRRGRAAFEMSSMGTSMRWVVLALLVAAYGCSSDRDRRLVADSGVDARSADTSVDDTAVPPPECTGSAPTCTGRSEEECAAVVGCSYGACVEPTFSRSCVLQSFAGDCAEIGCEWNARRDWCDGAPTPCSSVRSEARCGSIRCSWRTTDRNAECQGAPVRCDSLTRATCSTQVGCSLPESPDASVADSAQPDSARPDSGRSDGAAPDSGLPDSGRPDTSTPPGCDVGETCNPTVGCRVSSTCVGESFSTVGGASDPITGLPGGGSAVRLPSWVGGYCTETAAVDRGGCDPSDVGSCGGGSCGTCVNAGTDSRGVTVGMCAASCTPNAIDNSSCRDWYQCSLTTGACIPGCQNDTECRVVRQDTNGNGIIDPYDAVTNTSGDRLVYDATTSARCNLTTYRCEHSGRAGADAGDACEHDFECEQNGDCIVDSGSAGGWTGGYCTRFGCDVSGVSCAGSGRCQARGLGVAMCVAPCEVARTVTPGDRFSGAVGCRAGYGCRWDGVGGAGAPNGACIPGEYNAVRTPNVGAACVDDSTCYSPFGLGQCRDFGAGNHCTFFDCAAPGMPSDTCGAGALCASISGSDTTICVKTCTDASQCNAGNGCWDTTAAGISTGGGRVCFPGCLVRADCRAGEACVGASATVVGSCV